MRGLAFILIWLVSLSSRGFGFDCLDLDLKPVLKPISINAPLDDFLFREQLPQTEIPKKDWETCCGSWGPCPLSFPQVVFPNEDVKKLWSQLRIVETAKKYIGLPYRHLHIPAKGGLDCSNFTSWVYNFALGVRFSSHVQKQSMNAGRMIRPEEELQPGDLIFMWDDHKTSITHVALYIGNKQVIDAREEGIKIRALSSSDFAFFAWARRLID